MAPILIIHEDHDLSATWLADRLAARGRTVECFSGCNFATAPVWHHRLGTAGVEIRIDFADGRSLGTRAYAGMINRLPYLPQTLLASFGGTDAEYARQEWFALYLSWLNALQCPMFNRPTPQGLAGHWRHPADWSALARRAGLPVLPWHQSEADDPMQAWTKRAPGVHPEIIATPSTIIDTLGLAPEMAEACRALAGLAGNALIGIRFEPDPDCGWRFASATVLPDLFAGGECLVDAIAAEFTP
jgi:hypothetical protein